LSDIIDPDLDQNIVDAGFIKDLKISDKCNVSFTVELTTPACPIKAEFERQCKEVVSNLDWVESVNVTMSAVTPTPQDSADRPGGLKDVTHVVAVYSCKGGVGKSTVAVNLAYTLAQMGARVGIFDADVYGPSLPTMVSPELRILQMDPETKEIMPTEYEGVKLVSFGFAGQGSAIMRGAMVSGLIQQLLSQTNWGKLDYLVIDFPPGTGDIQLTLCQSVALSAAVMVTTPQRLSFIDVAKGVRMFARLMVPCVAVVENMSYFEADGKTYHPFGTGAGERIQSDFGIKNLLRFPIVPDLSLASDDGRPLVVAQPTNDIAREFTELGAVVVQEIAKLDRASKNSASYDSERNVVVVSMPGDVDERFYLDPKIVRQNDTSAKSIEEWTRARTPIPEELQLPTMYEIESISPLGNYAVQITWKDQFNQVATFELLASLPRTELQPSPVSSIS